MVLSRPGKEGYALLRGNVPLSGYGDEGPKGGLWISEGPKQQRLHEVLDLVVSLGSSAGEVHAERRAPAGPVFDPRPTTVELGEALHEGETDPHPRRVSGRGTGGLAEGFEDLLPELRRDPRPVVLDHQQQASVLRDGTNPDLRAGRGVAEGVRDEVLDDPFDLGGIQADREGFDVDRQVVAVAFLRLVDGSADQFADVGLASLRRHDPSLEAIQVEQVAQQPFELAGVGGD